MCFETRKSRCEGSNLITIEQAALGLNRGCLVSVALISGNSAAFFRKQS